ncbi:hypothetical protein A9264_02755 [Vibrio sp. UCD-FRSSP16_10]|nr:hypothetical protein A9260_04205 [Vibrio sp. UCD-FRSSP16_30]OBT20407.1 hypothetical protein A9264_02755 [Vibrio sp. UCD-FRSSP16_10]
MPGCDARLPQLLHSLPVNNATLKHSIGLTEYRASRYFGRLPTYTAEAGLLALCTVNFLSLPSDPAVSQQRPCDSDYLPLSRGDSGFFQPDGFASFAGQTKKALAFLLRLSYIWSDTRGSLSLEHKPDLNLGKVALYQLIGMKTL